MLQLAQRTSAPRLVSVSISTAVWIVMWRLPVMRAPASGCSPAYFSRRDMRPGISCCASSISLRPYSASDRSATLKSVLVAVVVVTLFWPPWWFGSVGWRGWLSGDFGEGEQALVLLLLPAEPVALVHALRLLGGRLEPGVDGVAHVRVVAQALGERDVGEPAVVLGEQLAQGAKPLQLCRAEDAVAGCRAVRLDQPDALQVAEHPGRPSGGLSRLVDGQAVGHRRPTLARLCQGSRYPPIHQVMHFKPA